MTCMLRQEPHAVYREVRSNVNYRIVRAKSSCHRAQLYNVTTYIGHVVSMWEILPRGFFQTWNDAGSVVP